MTKIAIDVAILPPEEIMDKVIAINKQEARKGNARGTLAKDDFYPHISLAMGTINEKDLEEIKKIVDNICKEFNPLSVEFSELYYATKKDGSKSYALKVKNTSDLQKIHEKLMRELLSHLSYDATEENLFKKEGENINPPGHLNKYKENSFEKFDPHLTLRCKEVEFTDLPIKFLGSFIAICHVGTGTTCRRILFQTKLTK